MSETVILNITIILRSVTPPPQPQEKGMGVMFAMKKEGKGDKAGGHDPLGRWGCTRYLYIYNISGLVGI